MYLIYYSVVQGQALSVQFLSSGQALRIRTVLIVINCITPHTLFLYFILPYKKLTETPLF